MSRTLRRTKETWELNRLFKNCKNKINNRYYYLYENKYIKEFDLNLKRFFADKKYWKKSSPCSCFYCEPINRKQDKLFKLIEREELSRSYKFFDNGYKLEYNKYYEDWDHISDYYDECMKDNQTDHEESFHSELFLFRLTDRKNPWWLEELFGIKS